MLGLNKGKLSIGQPIYRFENNHSVDFDGVDDFIQLGQPISYTQHTISTWIKVSDTSASKTIIDARDANDDGIRLYLSSAEVVTYQLNTSDINSGSAISVDEWHHIVATYDGTTQKLYIDGSLVDSTATSQTISTTTNAEIGSRNFSDRANEFLGKIDELAIWDRALTAAEVTEIYRIKFGANLIQNGRFDEISDELVSNPNFTMGADLIQNGNLDELGSEKVNNGNFTTDSFWAIVSGTNANISGGKANFVNAAKGQRIQQNFSFSSNKTYKIVIVVSNYSSGALGFYMGGAYAKSDITANGTYTLYHIPTNNTEAFFRAMTNGVTHTFSIDSITVKQVDPNERWSLDTGWAYSNNGVTCSSGNGTFQTNGLTLTGSTFHKLTFDIVTYESGTLNVDLGNSAGDATFTSAGSKTIFMNSGGFNRPRFYGGAFRGTISNITVQEVSGWSVSTRRGFAIDSNGHLEINSSLVEDTGSITYASLTLPSSPFVDGESYKIVITDLNVTSGAFELKYGRTHSSTPARPILTSADNGTYIEYFKAVNTADDITINNLGGTLATLSSISIKKLDPNNRWNNIDGNLTIVNNGGKLTGTDSGQARLYSIPAPTSAGKTYKVSYTVVENNGTSLQHYDGDSYETITSTVGDHSFIYTRQGSNNNFILRNPSGASAFIVLTNIMLQEQKYVATNLKLNSGNYKSADPVIVSTKSIQFDGIEEHLDLGTQSATSSLTYSAWVKVTDTDASTILSYGNTLLRLGTATSIQFWSDVSEPQLSTSVSTLTNVWSHIVVTQTGQNVKIYLNGVQVNSTSSNPPVNTGANISSIGRYAQGDLWYFTGQIDDVGIFNVALTSDQVIELYNQGVPSNLSTHSANANLTGYWKMGDGTLDEAPLIADQTNATLGSELVTNGDFATDSDWSKGTGWSIANGVASCDGSQTSTSNFSQGNTFDTPPQTLSDTYKLTFDLVVTQGSITASSGSLSQSYTTSGSKILYGIPATGAGNLNFTASSNFIGSIDNVSVKQVNGNPALMINTPTIVTDAPLTKIRNYYRMGDGLLDKHQADNITLYSTRGLICDMVEPSLGAELITDGDFPAGTSAWTLGTGWQLTTGACVRSGHSTNTDFRQSISITANKVYQVSYTRVYVSGTRTTNLFSDFETDGSNITLGDYRGTEETVTVVSFFMPTYTGTVPIRVFGINDWTGSITNVSVKEVNGVGGLMTNMLNTDITNDVPS